MHIRTIFKTLIRTLFFILCNFNYLWTFNLETRLPIIKEGPAGSYFGYSVAEHVIIRDGRKENVLLIGAPKAYTGTEPSGAIYKCPVSTYKGDCKQLFFEEEIRSRKHMIKDDQWLGVTVQSQGPGGYVMVCAHRYIEVEGENQWARGICYSLEQDLEYSRPWNPCLNRPVRKGHEEYGYCQAGTSGLLTEDNEIVLGTPGPYTWRGTIFQNNVRFGHRDDKEWYFGEVEEIKSPPTDKYSYLGMSVTAGIFFGNEKSYVSGAPRSIDTGQVVFLAKNFTNRFIVQFILDGEQIASSFGYSLASLDINKDGYLDLIVSAPFYYDKEKGGAVYIYMNSATGINRNTIPIKLFGKPESRFGFALENAGDLNQDGFPDLVIGAPYEGDGAVYIYLGSSDGLITTPSQIIRASDIHDTGRLTTFGYSLDGGIDIDDNSYPDLLIGSYDSDTVVLLRSRPVLDIITFVKDKLPKIDPEKIGCEDDKDSPDVCFSFQTCFQFNSSEIQSVRLKYKIEAETFTGKKYYRVQFQSSLEDDSPNIVEKEITLKGLSVRREHCPKEVVYLKDKSEIQTPVQFKLSYSLIQREPDSLHPGEAVVASDLNPILNQKEASKIFEVPFLKDCGSDDICTSDLKISADVNLEKNDQQLPFLKLGQENVVITVTVSNIGEPAYEAMLFITHPSSISYVKLERVKGNQITCSVATNETLSCDLGNPLKQTKVEFRLHFNPKNVDEEKSLHLSINANTTSEELTPEPDIKITIGVVKVAELSIRGISKPEKAFYGGNVNNIPIYEDEIGTEVSHIYEIFNDGPWRATSIEMVITWPYEVGGPYDQGKWLLYIIETPEVIGNGYCKLNNSQLNPLDIKMQPQELRLSPDDFIYRQRRRREAETQELRAEGKATSIVTLSCESRTARCFQFSCIFNSLDKKSTAHVKIRSRLWNSTLVNDYSEVDEVRIISNAHILIGPDNIKQKEDNDFASVETKAYPDILFQKSEGVPLWIIIIAACAGLLILILLIIILWKCGFFKRKKPGYEPAPSSDKDFM